MKKFCLALLIFLPFFCAYGMDDDNNFGGHLLTNEEAKKAGMLTGTEIVQQFPFARAVTPVTLDEWIEEVYMHQEADPIQHHLVCLFSNFFAISKNITTKNFDAAYAAFENVNTLREEVSRLQKSNPTLWRLLRTAHCIHLEPNKTPFITAFAQAKEKVFQDGRIDPNTLTTAETKQLTKRAWNQCTNELKTESEIRWSRVVRVGAALNKCEPEAWINITQTQLAMLSTPKKQNSSCGIQ